MGRLFVVDDSFEIGNIPVADRNAFIVSFCEAFTLATQNGDQFYGSAELYTRVFSYGTWLQDFIYAEWPALVQNQHLKGISLDAHNLIHNILMPFPGLIGHMMSSQEFWEHFQTTFAANTGLEMCIAPSPFVCCKKSWHKWRAIWLSQHQTEIQWEQESDSFLPNKTFSNTILTREVKEFIRNSIKDQNVEIEIEKEAKRLFTEMMNRHGNSIGVVFHMEIMKVQGPNIAAYTQEIGTEIAEANYYVFEEELSRAEQNKVRSLRKIFSLANSMGRKQYISLDHKHGMFEYLDEKGAHLGEYKFDSSYNSDPEDSHNLKTI